MGGEFRREWIHVLYVWFSAFSPETTTMLLICYTSTQSIFGVKIKKKTIMCKSENIKTNSKSSN